ncbi:thioesterase superfamily protein [Plectosphaerella plurivora]|uniref:Thioesterase superfamily protein n=1 Tax=Plectosphaerella plurivora TaxID=936078 RepID=A0A9P8VGY1_9PEZI|nr:thioesterase superfamily protein [Plectosphaerella plurivora]
MAPDPNASLATLPQTSDDFSSIPWCKALLTAPNTTVFIPASRDPSQTRSHRGHDQLFSRTLSGPDVIPACICFHATPAPGSHAPVTELSTLFSLAGGVDGYPGVVHGGAVAVLMDEILGVLVQQNMDLGSDHAVFRSNPATATMDVRFRRPIPTPGVVRGRGRVVKLEGRKLHLAAKILNAGGEVLASCESIWVTVDRKPRL